MRCAKKKREKEQNECSSVSNVRNGGNTIYKSIQRQNIRVILKKKLTIFLCHVIFSEKWEKFFISTLSFLLCLFVFLQYLFLF